MKKITASLAIVGFVMLQGTSAGVVRSHEVGSG
jgi:hypothetical protein